MHFSGSSPAESVSGNHLLASLPDADQRRLRPLLHAVTIKARQVLYTKGDPIEQVYFLTGGVCSLVAAMDDGRMAELATIGREGVVGFIAGFGQEIASHEAMLQIPVPGETEAGALAMSARDFRAEMAQAGAFRDAVNKYIVAANVFLETSIACNALHGTEERCARWLLMVQDRIGSATFQLSHEFLAMMLGVHRPTATVVAGTLQAAGLIRYRRGRMEILNREGLEEASCECYAIVAQHFTALRPAPAVE